ncbi:hypothetical protein TKK_0019444 [Trichogramma kaykai]
MFSIKRKPIVIQEAEKSDVRKSIDQAAASYLVLVSSDLDDGGGVASSSGYGRANLSLSETTGTASKTTSAVATLVTGDLDDGGGVAAGSGYGRSGVTLEDTVVAETTWTTTADDSSLESTDLDWWVATTATDADESTLAQGTAATSATVVDDSALQVADVDFCEKRKEITA